MTSPTFQVATPTSYGACIIIYLVQSYTLDANMSCQNSVLSFVADDLYRIQLYGPVKIHAIILSFVVCASNEDFLARI